MLIFREVGLAASIGKMFYSRRSVLFKEKSTSELQSNQQSRVWLGRRTITNDSHLCRQICLVRCGCNWHRLWPESLSYTHAILAASFSSEVQADDGPMPLHAAMRVGRGRRESLNSITVDWPMIPNAVPTPHLYARPSPMKREMTSPASAAI